MSDTVHRSLFLGSFWWIVLALQCGQVLWNSPFYLCAGTLVRLVSFNLLCRSISEIMANTTLRLQCAFILLRLFISHAILCDLSLGFLFTYASLYYLAIHQYLSLQLNTRYVQQVQRQNADLVGHYREAFNIFRSEYQPTRHAINTHNILAHERRECERFVIEKCIPSNTEFRQPGANLLRHQETMGRMHVCRHPFEPKDMQRSSAGNRYGRPVQQHYGCNRPGEFCPRRYELGYCLLSHVDYHLKPEQLCEMVTGPTFIIRHRMVTGPIGCYQDGHEADIRIIGDYCHMQVQGGQSYYHKFLDFADSTTDSEGVISSKNGFVHWQELGRIGDTCIYYCFPYHGIQKYTVTDDAYDRGQNRVVRQANGDVVCFSKRAPPDELKHCTVPSQLYELLHDDIMYRQYADGNLQTLYNFVHNYCKNQIPDFKYISLLTEYLLYKIQKDQFLSAGEHFRLENYWDQGWLTPVYDHLFRLDQLLWAYSIEEYIEKIVMCYDGRHTILNLLFRHTVVTTRRLPLFDVPNYQPPENAPTLRQRITNLFARRPETPTTAIPPAYQDVTVRVLRSNIVRLANRNQQWHITNEHNGRINFTYSVNIPEFNLDLFEQLVQRLRQQHGCIYTPALLSQEVNSLLIRQSTVN